MTDQMSPPPGSVGDRALQHAARRLAELSEGRPELADRARRLAERVSNQRFHIAVLGEFKRGKSTLVNALIGQQILPSGVVPLTAVATEVHFGTGQSSVVFADGRRLQIRVDEIGEYVTERANPANVKAVARVEVGTDGPFGAPGLVLVDTPGVASVNEHNTLVAREVLDESDAAVLVLSADSPMSESELNILDELGARRERVFVVINKSDHLSDDELDEVKGFVVERLRRALSSWSGPYCTDARAALQGSLRAPERAMRGFSELRAALARFVADDLASARRDSARLELRRLAGGLDQALELESAAGSLDAHALSTQLARFEAAVSDGRRALDEDRLVLAHEVEQLAGDAGRRLAEMAASSARACRPELAPVAKSLPTRRLDTELRRATEQCVRREFEPIRREISDELDAAWSQVAGRFTARVTARIDGLVDVAGELFDVHLPVAPVPPVASQRERFSYLFIHIESPTAPIGRLLSVVLPPRVARRHALRSAEGRLVQEFDKHAGRARYDLEQRLKAVEHELVATMVAEYEDTQSSLVRAVQGAQSLLALSAEERAGRDRRREEARSLLGEVERLEGDASPRRTDR